MSEDLKPQTKFVFVEMLFALAVGEIAQKATTVVPGDAIEWCAVSSQSAIAMCSYLHLGLASVTVAASYVGWRHSSAIGHLADARSVFSLAFIVLLLDAWLVLTYIILVHRVDGPRADEISECFWMLIIFISYAGWGFITRGLMRDRTVIPRLLTVRLVVALGPALVCSAIAYAFLYTSLATPTPARVWATDVGLASSVLLFRAVRPWADQLLSAFSSEAGIKHPSPTMGNMPAWCMLCSVIVAGCFLVRLVLD